MIDPEYFVQKRIELGFDGQYPGMTRAKILHQGVLRIIVTNAPVAGALRMRQMELIQVFTLEDTRIAISIGDLN